MSISDDFDKLTLDKNTWLHNFLHDKSDAPSQDKTIQEISQTVLSSETLKELVLARYLDGKRFLGWTANGSKGYTDITTGDIRIGKTGTGTEAFTLGYECINSKNSKIYRKIGIKYAQMEVTTENRQAFAHEILAVEAEAMLMKCKLATELGHRDMVKEHYLRVYDDDSLEVCEKKEKIKELMVQFGKVKFDKPAYLFYQTERYDETTDYYKKLIEQHRELFVQIVKLCNYINKNNIKIT